MGGAFVIIFLLKKLGLLFAVAAAVSLSGCIITPASGPQTEDVLSQQTVSGPDYGLVQINPETIATAVSTPADIDAFVAELLA